MVMLRAIRVMGFMCQLVGAGPYLCMKPDDRVNTTFLPASYYGCQEDGYCPNKQACLHPNVGRRTCLAIVDYNCQCPPGPGRNSSMRICQL